MWKFNEYSNKVWDFPLPTAAPHFHTELSSYLEDLSNLVQDTNSEQQSNFRKKPPHVRVKFQSKPVKILV